MVYLCLRSQGWKEEGQRSGQRGAFSNDLRLLIFPKSPFAALGVLEKSAQTGTNMENKTPQAGVGGVEGPVAAVSQNQHTGPKHGDLWFTSEPLIKRKQLAPPCPGLPSGRIQSYWLRAWLVWLPLTQRLALRTSRKVEHQT